MTKLSLATIAVALLLGACSATTVETTTSSQGNPAGLADLERAIAKPGVVKFQKHVSGDWAVNLSGLVNLEHPAAKAAGLEDRLEPIQIYTYSLVHPEYGTYIVDSGLSSSFLAPEDNDDVSFIVKQAMGTELLKVHLTTGDLATELGGIDGVFLTHIHMDHIMGLTDLGADTAVFIGPGDASATAATHALTRGTTDRLLGDIAKLEEWDYSNGDVIDIFGDGSVWAIHSPGHTPGATAYLANTTTGVHLMLGDVTHTKWGWENGVEPGTFSADIPMSAASLQRLKQLAEAHPQIVVHPGHQSL